MLSSTLRRSRCSCSAENCIETSASLPESSSASLTFSRSRSSAASPCWHLPSADLSCAPSCATSRSLAPTASSWQLSSFLRSSVHAISMEPLSFARCSLLVDSSFCFCPSAEALSFFTSSSALSALPSCLRICATSCSRSDRLCLVSLSEADSFWIFSSFCPTPCVFTCASSSSLTLSCFWCTVLSFWSSFSLSLLSCARSACISSSLEATRLLCAAVSLASLSSFSFCITLLIFSTSASLTFCSFWLPLRTCATSSSRSRSAFCSLAISSPRATSAPCCCCRLLCSACIWPRSSLRCSCAWAISCCC
mmetsp:Transcript_56450/g.135482  ORF Transcript_56450/g.135482 Transcript_56450/m.135482 type:complete len:308 (-) Transcript_56450:122-1045(-)